MTKELLVWWWPQFGLYNTAGHSPGTKGNVLHNLPSWNSSRSIDWFINLARIPEFNPKAITESSGNQYLEGELITRACSSLCLFPEVINKKAFYIFKISKISIFHRLIRRGFKSSGDPTLRSWVSWRMEAPWHIQKGCNQRDALQLPSHTSIV